MITGDYCLSVGMPDLNAPKGWKWRKLTDLARLETGHTPSRKFPEYWGGDVPWVGIRDATANHGQMIYETKQYTNNLGIANSSARILPENTVCLSRTASVGYVIVMGTPMATSQDFVNWVCDPEKLDYSFLMYILLAENRSFLRFASGTTHQTIYFPEVKAFHVCVPSLDHQKAISRILSTLDDKIELNRRMNETLESMARTLFKSWFVDFDPVIDNALAAGNAIPEPLQARAETRLALGPARQPLPPNIQKLFPAAFQFDEELGWIPKGWEVVTTEDVSTKIAMGPFGSNIKVSTFVNEGVPIISGYHLNKPLLTDDNYRFITEEHADKLLNSNVINGDIVFTHAGNIGQVSLVPRKTEFPRYVISQRQFYLRPDKSKVDGSFLLYFYRSHIGQYKLLANTSQVGVPSIARPSSHLKSIELVLPPRRLCQIFDTYCNEMFAKVVAVRDQVSGLTKLRDTLLPKLLSGELRIPDAEQLVADSL
ncbi:MAG: restriction endonuclease subunit S [bacterium]|nr:restriction endonuclease subunit S [bacterium]